jgi:hypothetical protein
VPVYSFRGFHVGGNSVVKYGGLPEGAGFRVSFEISTRAHTQL